MTRLRLVIVLRSVNNTYLQSQRSLFFDLSESSYHHHHLLSKPAIYVYSLKWSSRKVLLLRWGSCAACGLATEGENLFTIRFWRFWTRNTKSWRHRNTKKKQEKPNLENILFISSSENLKDNFRPVQKLMGRVVRQPKFIWIKTIKAIELRSSWWSRSCSCFGLSPGDVYLTTNVKVSKTT